MLRLVSRIIILLSLNLIVLASAFAYDDKTVKLKPTIENSVALVYAKKGEFEDVRDDLIMAIQDQGAVVSYVAHSSEMLDRTAVTLNIKQKVYQKAEIILFCKAEISHKLLQANPHSLILCPYPIAVYSLSAQPDTIYLSIQKPPKDVREYKAVHQLLLKILRQVLEF